MCTLLFEFFHAHTTKTFECKCMGHATDIDRILHVEDYIYKYSKSVSQLQHEYLLILNDVPRYICYTDKTFSWSIRKHILVTYQIITEVNIL